MVSWVFFMFNSLLKQRIKSLEDQVVKLQERLMHLRERKHWEYPPYPACSVQINSRFNWEEVEVRLELIEKHLKVQYRPVGRHIAQLVPLDSDQDIKFR